MSIEKAIVAAAYALIAELERSDGSDVYPSKESAPVKRGPGRPAKTIDVASQLVALAAVPAPAGNIAPAATALTVSFKDVADALSALVNAGGRDAGVALLAKYGAPKASVLKPEQFAAFLAEVQALNKQPAPVAAAPTSLI